jgi:hypothetical protein
MQLSPLSLLPCALRPKHLPQHPILEYPQPVNLPQFVSPSFTPTQKTTGIMTVMYILICTFLDSKLEIKDSELTDNKH